MRTRLSRAGFLLLLIALIAPPAFAQVSGENYHGQITVNEWKPSPDLVIRSGSSDDVDLVSTFGIEKKAFPDFNVILKPGQKHKIRFEYVDMKYDQDATINRTFSFAGRTYSVNVAANAKIDWKFMRVGYEWDFVHTKMGYAGVIGEVKFNQVKAALTAPAIGAASTTDTKAPVPAIGFAAGGYLVPKFFSVAFEASGIKVPKRDTFEARFVDFDASGTVHLGPYFGVQTGYRSLDARYVVDADAGTLKMKGPYVGASVRF